MTQWVKKINGIIKPSKKGNDLVGGGLLNDLKGNGEPLNLNIQPMFNLANEFLQQAVEVSLELGSAEHVTDSLMQILQYIDGA